MDKARPLLEVATLAGLKVPQLALNATKTPDEAFPLIAPETEIADVSSAPILEDAEVRLLKLTFEAADPKFKVFVTETELSVALADKIAAPVVVRLKGLIKTRATPLASVKTVAPAVLPARVATA